MTGARGDFSKGYMCRYRTICILVSVNNHTSASSKNRRPISTRVPWCKMDKLTTVPSAWWKPLLLGPKQSDTFEVCLQNDWPNTNTIQMMAEYALLKCKLLLSWYLCVFWLLKKKSLACVRTRTSASGGPSLSNLQKQYFSVKTSDMEWYLCTELITNTVIND